MSDTVTTLAAKMRPFWLRDLGASAPAASGSGGMVAHALNGPYHTGTLDASQAPWALTTARTLTAGAGLTGGGDLSADRSFAVGAGLGITVNADDVALTTPGTLTVSSTNSSSGSHTHAITASSDVGTSPAAALLKSGASGELTLNNGFFTQGAQSSATFASGFAGSGWRADYGVTTASRASIETDDLTVRGRMRVYELLIQQIRATNGSLLVTSSSKVVTVSSSTNPLWTVNGSQLTFNGSNATLTFTLYTITTSTSGEDAAAKRTYHGFLYGDIIRAQQVEWNGSSFGGVIQSNLEVTAVTNLYTYDAAYVSGDAPAVGYDFVRLGNSSNTARQGVVYLTSDDSAAPFIDIADNISYHSDWNSAGAIKARLGKLSGISDAAFGGALSGYGLYSSNVYLKGQIVVTGGDLGGLAAADVNSNTTTIDGGKITANSVTASRISVSTLSAIAADMGTLTAGAITIGSSNKIWLNDSADGALNIGGSTKASAPFQVTAAGALTATSATVTGTLNAAGGGIVSGNWYIGYDINYAGYMYVGTSGAVRFGIDGEALVMPAINGVTIPTSSSAIRWFPDISTSYTHTNAKNYSGIVGYKHTGISTIDNIWTAYVGTTDYATYAARVMLQAGHMDGGSVYTDARIEVVREAGTGWRYVAIYGDRLEVNGAIGAATMTAPAASWATGSLIYTDTADGDLKVRFANGTVKVLATN